MKMIPLLIGVLCIAAHQIPQNKYSIPIDPVHRWMVDTVVLICGVAMIAVALN